MLAGGWGRLGWLNRFSRLGRLRILLLEQFSRLDPQGPGELFQLRDGRVLLASLHAVDPGFIDSGIGRQVVLRHALLDPEPLDIARKELVRGHSSRSLRILRDKAPRSPAPTRSTRLPCESPPSTPHWRLRSFASPSRSGAARQP